MIFFSDKGCCFSLSDSLSNFSVYDSLSLLFSQCLFIALKSVFLKPYLTSFIFPSFIVSIFPRCCCCFTLYSNSKIITCWPESKLDRHSFSKKLKKSKKFQYSRRGEKNPFANEVDNKGEWAYLEQVDLLGEPFLKEPTYLYM